MSDAKKLSPGLIDLVRSMQADHTRMTADELDRCAQLLNARASVLQGSQDPTIPWSKAQDPTNWDVSDAMVFPVVPFRQHYDPRTGRMVVTLIDPEDFYAD